MFMSKSPRRDLEVVNLSDDAATFLRSRARAYRRHVELVRRHIRTGEITAWEKARLLESIASCEASGQYWDNLADNYTPKF